MEEQTDDKENAIRPLNNPSLKATHKISLEDLNSIERKICGEIQNQQLSIAKSQHHFNLKDKPKTLQASSIETIKKKKAELKERLIRLNVSEAEMRRNQLNRSLHHREKSTFTPSDAKLIKKLQKSFREFEREVNKKTEAVETEEEAIKQEQRKKQQEDLLKEKEERKRNAEKWLEEHSQMKNDSKLTENGKNQSLGTSADALYLKMDKLYKQRQDEQLRKLDQLRESLRKHKREDFDDIKQHELKHEQHCREKQQQREERLKKLVDQHASRLKSLNPKSKFYQQYKAEEEQRRKDQEEKELEPWLNARKKVEYGRAVKDVHLPRIKCRQNTVVDNPSPKKKTLNHHEQYIMGNQYLLDSKKIASQHIQVPRPAGQSLALQKAESKYPNYLKHTAGKGATDEERLMRMLDRKEKSVLEVAEHTRILSHKLDEQARHDPKRILQNLKIKLNIIDRLSS